MSEKPSPLLPDDEPSRDRLRAALALACALAVVLAGVVVPAVSGAGLGRTPLGSVVPQPGVDPYGGSGGGSAGGGLGALNPGSRTSVGGSLASDAGAFRSQNAETHFTVRSTAASYWRTGAYDTYTGSGWKRSGDRRPYTGPIEGGGIQGREVRYSVTLRQSATALPTVWRPAAVSGTATDSLAVTDRRAVVADDPVAAGTTYSGVSHRPPRDPALLRTAGTDYPEEIEREYTQLPDSTDPRLSDFTDDLTADADNPYETASRIESWLESNKNYSLNVSQPTGEDVASQFVFEMEKGYCEYFATAMTAMLRTQGVPARYAVGYSTGQSVGENTYRVRAMNAHAWVEVYFPEVGWVRFDPTPGSARLQSEQRAFANQTGADAGRYAPNESGSPGEQFSPNGSAGSATTGAGSPPGTATGGGSSGTSDGSGAGTTSGAGASGTSSGGTGGDSGTATGSDSGTATAGGGEGTGGTTDGAGGTTSGDGATTDPSGEGATTTATDSPNAPANSPYDVELNRTPVPGATVAVTVTDNASAVAGVPVYFNGERVGVTDESGTVTGQVPYAERLRITLGGWGDDAESLVGPGSDAPDSDGRFVTGPPADFDAPLALTGGPPPTLGGADRPQSRSLGAAAPGNETNGTEYPLATNATLTVSGEVATGSEVVVTATVSDVPVRNARVTLGDETVGTTDRRGRVRVTLPESPGNVTLAVARGSVSGERTVAIPRLELSVDPALPLALPWTPVEVRATYGGDPLANASVRVAGADRTTDVDGTATASLPFRGSAEVVVAAKGQTRRTTVSGLYANLAGVLGGLALLLGGVAYAARRRGVAPRSLAAALLGALRALPSLAVGLLFGAADRLSAVIQAVLDALAELRAGEATARELLARLRTWLAERLRAVRRSAAEDWSADALGDDPASGTESSTDPQADSYRTLREAWETFLRAVSVRRPAAATPGELADHAVREDDLPAEPVATLRDAFRDVEYGARSPDDRLPQVESAAEAIERAMRPDDPEAADAETDDDAAGRDGGRPDDSEGSGSAGPQAETPTPGGDD